MYPSTSLFIAVGQLAIVSLIVFSYPLQVHPCRNCLDKIFQRGVLVKREDEDEMDEHVDGDMTTRKHAVLTGAIVLFGFIIAYNVDDLQLGKWPESDCQIFALIRRPGKFSPLWGPRGRRRYRLFFRDSFSGR